MDSTPVGEINVVEATEGYLFATWRNVMIVVWDYTPTRPAVESLRRRMSVLARTHPGGIALVNVSAPSNPVVAHPDERTRQAVLAMLRDASTGVRAIAMLLGGQSFLASGIRAALAGLILLARPAAPVKFFDRDAAAAGWLAEALPRAGAASFGPSELATALAAARARLARPPAAT